LSREPSLGVGLTSRMLALESKCIHIVLKDQYIHDFLSLCLRGRLSTVHSCMFEDCPNETVQCKQAERVEIREVAGIPRAHRRNQRVKGQCGDDASVSAAIGPANLPRFGSHERAGRQATLSAVFAKQRRNSRVDLVGTGEYLGFSLEADPGSRLQQRWQWPLLSLGSQSHPLGRSVTYGPDRPDKATGWFLVCRICVRV
jgi:hypothetical protein